LFRSGLGNVGLGNVGVETHPQLRLREKEETR
jgi:hypothetical protein